MITSSSPGREELLEVFIVLRKVFKPAWRVNTHTGLVDNPVSLYGTRRLSGDSIYVSVDVVRQEFIPGQAPRPFPGAKYLEKICLIK